MDINRISIAGMNSFLVICNDFFPIFIDIFGHILIDISADGFRDCIILLYYLFFRLLVDHFGWLTRKDDVKHSIEFITSLMKMKFPNKPIVMVIGNHDIHPSDA